MTNLIHECYSYTFFFAEVGDKSLEYRFACSGSGDVVPLEAMCNGSVECTNGKDETHAFCPSKRTKRSSCDPNDCLNSGYCDDEIGDNCVCYIKEFIGDHCQYGKSMTCMDSCRSQNINIGFLFAN